MTISEDNSETKKKKSIENLTTHPSGEKLAPQ